VGCGSIAGYDAILKTRKRAKGLTAICGKLSRDNTVTWNRNFKAKYFARSKRKKTERKPQARRTFANFRSPRRRASWTR